MNSAISKRVELAKLCSSRNWSKAIRVLDLLLTQSCAIQGICLLLHSVDMLMGLDRADLVCGVSLVFRFSLEFCVCFVQLMMSCYVPLHGILGRSFSALGRKEDAIAVWEQGQPRHKFNSDNHVADPKLSTLVSELRPYINGKSNETLKQQKKYNTSRLFQEHRDVSEFHNKSTDNFDIHNRTSDEERSKSSMSLSELLSDTNGKTCENYKSINVLSDGSKLTMESADASKNSSISGGNCDIGLSDQTSANELPCGLTNGTHNNFDKPSYASDACNDLSEKSEQCSKSSVIFRNSSDITGNHCLQNNTSDIHNEINFRLSRAIAQVNEGNYAYAISIFDQILKEDPTYPEALIGRGTAYAFQRELEAAIADFTKAIQSEPSAGEAWKRRGQARAALGESIEAIEDLTKALEFDPNSADILHERGIINFKFRDFNAAVGDLSACMKLDKNNKSAYTYLGMALSSIGEYKRAEEAHLKSIQLDQSFLEAWAHLTQFYQDLANSKKALECLQQVIQIDGRYSKAYHLRGLLLHGMGEHRKAIKDLSIGLSVENSDIECLYLRASCYHAIGEYADAVKDYDAALDVELDSMEKFVLQRLAFYQKEIALYTASKVNSEFCWLDIDGNIDPLFKEYWCKRLHPKNHKTALLLVADSIGKKIQYDCPGFLPNRRQHRIAGLAAIEIAQKVSKAWRSLQADWKHSNRSLKNGKRLQRKERISMASQNRGGAGCSTNSSSETSASYGITEDRSSSRPMMPWRDVYSLAVKWRQISEPCDPVVWVNKLSEEFNSGFGSHTPMVLGQAKVVRYFPNYERTLDIAKTIMKDKHFVHNKADEIIDLSKEGKTENIVHAKSCDDLYELVGEDFWLATWCNSTAVEGKQLEGTRITIVKMGQHGYDFAIRTPCTPSRWEDFDTEMAMAWEAICNASCGETYGSTDFNVLKNVREAILRMTYFWYDNIGWFMF
ncbi:hypothetical protein CRYUN_Cryun17cG0115200 [Craigia yunnanensis]